VIPTTIFADTGGFGHMDGYGWAGGMNPWWILMVVLMVGFIIWAIIWTTQRNNDSTPADRTELCGPLPHERDHASNGFITLRLGERTVQRRL